MHKAFSPIYQSVRQREHYIIHQYKAGTIFFRIRPDLSGSVDKCTSYGTLITPKPYYEKYDKNLKKSENIFNKSFMYK